MALLSGLGLVTACVEDGDVELGEAPQAVTSTALTSWSCPYRAGNDFYGCSFDLGTASNRACFLAGLEGRLNLPNTPQGDGFGVATTSAGWRGITWGNRDGATVGGGSVCVTPATNLGDSYHWTTGSQPIYLGGGPNRLCFLTGAFTRSGFTYATDWVGVWHDTANDLWFLGGDTHGASAHAYARCITVSQILGEYTATSAGPSTSTLMASNSGGGVACALTKIGGQYVLDTDKVKVTYFNSSPFGAWWNLSVVGVKTASATCFR